MPDTNDPDDLELVEPRPSGRQEPYVPMGGRPAPLQDLHDGPRCPQCGYDLRGLTYLRCPECGHRPTREELLSHECQAALRRAARWQRRITILGCLMLIVGFGLSMVAGTAARSGLAALGFTMPLGLLSVIVLLFGRLADESTYCWVLLVLGAVWLGQGLMLWWVF